MTLFDVPAAGSGGGVASGGAPGPSPVRMTVAYDGTAFHGFARQRDQRTVAGVIEAALAQVLRTEVDLACAGRTDAGVHAWGQVISFVAPPGADPDTLRDRLNRMLGPEVVVREARFAAPGFDARHSARARTYRYTVLNRREPDPFMARTAWWVPDPIDLHALELAADPFIGEHDFAAFCRRGPAGSTTVRRILASEWHDLGDGVLRYEVRATAFCWQMVRALVGTQVEAGLGRRRPGAMLSILRSGDRAAAGALAPPHGLCLWHVAYDDEEHR